MINFLQKIKDPRLFEIINNLKLGDDAQFKKIQNRFPEYDSSFLWLLCYQSAEAIQNRSYVEGSYKKFYQILDPKFPQKLASNGNFDSRMWEMILCDILSMSGELMPKGEAGADFLLKDINGQEVQIEAVTPNEADDNNLRSIKPDYSNGKIFQLSGNIEDLERPILLRVFSQGFLAKAKKKYDKNKPLIVAINSSKTVGLSSWDQYVLRRLLFGLGFDVIRKGSDNSYSHELQQNSYLNKPGEKIFNVGVFRSSEYKHISGVIYTSQQPMGFIPGGSSWSNSGITFVRNPLAKHPVDLNFPFFKNMVCNEEIYQVVDAKSEFQSKIDLNS
jgi:hypothetical protein